MGKVNIDFSDEEMIRMVYAHYKAGRITWDVLKGEAERRGLQVNEQWRLQGLRLRKALKITRPEEQEASGSGGA